MFILREAATLPTAIETFHSRVIAGEGEIRGNTDPPVVVLFKVTEKDQILWPVLKDATEVWLMYGKPKGLTR